MGTTAVKGTSLHTDDAHKVAQSRADRGWFDLSTRDSFTDGERAAKIQGALGVMGKILTHDQTIVLLATPGIAIQGLLSVAAAINKHKGVKAVKEASKAIYKAQKGKDTEVGAELRTALAIAVAKAVADADKPAKASTKTPTDLATTVTEANVQTVIDAVFAVTTEPTEAEALVDYELVYGSTEGDNKEVKFTVKVTAAAKEVLEKAEAVDARKTEDTTSATFITDIIAGTASLTDANVRLAFLTAVTAKDSTQIKALLSDVTAVDVDFDAAITKLSALKDKSCTRIFKDMRTLMEKHNRGEDLDSDSAAFITLLTTGTAKESDDADAKHVLDEGDKGDKLLTEGQANAFVAKIKVIAESRLLFAACQKWFKLATFGRGCAKAIAYIFRLFLQVAKVMIYTPHAWVKYGRAVGLAARLQDGAKGDKTTDKDVKTAVKEANEAYVTSGNVWNGLVDLVCFWRADDHVTTVSCLSTVPASIKESGDDAALTGIAALINTGRDAFVAKHADTTITVAEWATLVVEDDGTVTSSADVPVDSTKPEGDKHPKIVDASRLAAISTQLTAALAPASAGDDDDDEEEQSTESPGT